MAFAGIKRKVRIHPRETGHSGIGVREGGSLPLRSSPLRGLALPPLQGRRPRNAPAKGPTGPRGLGPPGPPVSGPTGVSE
jgi:hypothetical protein